MEHTVSVSASRITRRYSTAVAEESTVRGEDRRRAGALVRLGEVQGHLRGARRRGFAGDRAPTPPLGAPSSAPFASDSKISDFHALSHLSRSCPTEGEKGEAGGDGAVTTAMRALAAPLTRVLAPRPARTPEDLAVAPGSPP